METRPTNQPITISQVARQAFDPEVQPQTPQTPIPDADKNGTFIRNFGRFERAGSTYYWHIFRPRREKLIGYSKPLNMAEKANKQELLMDCVKRLVKKGYTQEGMKIVFYRAFHESDDDQSVKLFTLHGNRYIPEPAVLYEAWLISFLKNIYSPPVFYYDRNAGLFPTGGKTEPPADTVLIPDPSMQPTAKEPFDLSRSFKSADTLLKYIQKLERDGHPHGRVADFYREKMKAFSSDPS